MNRREFLGALATASATVLAGENSSPQPAPNGGERARLEPFDYAGVKLRPSRWQSQYARARDFYLNVSNDDILHGFRAMAGWPAPGAPLGGWCSEESYQVFGQWLQAMSRASYATGDAELRDKASLLMTEWGKTLDGHPGASGRTPFQRMLAGGRLGHYFFDKIAGGLVDMHRYASHSEALPLLEKITDWAVTLLRRDNVGSMVAPYKKADGFPLEWYTLAENLYRAYEVTGAAKYRDFALVWHYPFYWDRFMDTSKPADTFGFHAYSHCNTLSSAAMAYKVTGEAKYLQIIRNAYDFFQETQCYATGGYGPGERLLPMDGALGGSLEREPDTFECPCGSWAGFKLSRYLMTFTGEARYGDWMEKLLYNGIGAALPMTGRGRTFYYSDYTLGHPAKVYYGAAFPCCSGTYFQDVTEYHNLIYFKDSAGLRVNLYLPSEVAWETNGAKVRLIQETDYPEKSAVKLKLELSGPAAFALKFRVPGWSRGVSAKVNGDAQDISAKPGEWAVLSRRWQSGDVVEIEIPLLFRKLPVDGQHPNRVAFLRGPVVMVQDLAANDLKRIPSNEALQTWFSPTERSGIFQARAAVEPQFAPYYVLGAGHPYRMYFDQA